MARMGDRFCIPRFVSALSFMGDSREEGRSDNVRRVFCNEGMHQNVGSEVAYANTSTKEQQYAQKYYGFRFKEDGRPSRQKRRRVGFGNVEIVAESGLLQATAQLSWVQPQMTRWFGNRFVNRFMSPNCTFKASQHYSALDAMSIFYEGADLDLSCIREKNNLGVKRMCASSRNEVSSSECGSNEL
jgi:hypothetical protein